jgi:hypothetical protein
VPRLVRDQLAVEQRGQRREFVAKVGKEACLILMDPVFGKATSISAVRFRSTVSTKSDEALQREISRQA